jgi:hypothetical protein
MPLPSLYLAADGARAWSIARAAAYGGGIGAVAALFKTFGPEREAGLGTANFVEIAAAAFGFALLCSVAAILRNFIVRRLVSPQTR